VLHRANTSRQLTHTIITGNFYFCCKKREAEILVANWLERRLKSTWSGTLTFLGWLERSTCTGIKLLDLIAKMQRRQENVVVSCRQRRDSGTASGLYNIAGLALSGRVFFNPGNLVPHFPVVSIGL